MHIMPQIGRPCEWSGGSTVADRMPISSRTIKWVVGKWVMGKWVVGLGAGAAWALRRLVHTRPFYDEWTLIAQVLHTTPWRAATASFNGHLWLFQDLLYRAQVHWFGVDHHWLVVVVFVMALVALHAAVARLALAVGVPLGTALLVGLVVTYLGRGSQDFIFAVQVSPMASLALSLEACRSVLVRDGSRRAVLRVMGLTLLAAVTESGLGAIGVCMVAVLVAGCWGVRRLVSVAPSVVVLVAWLAFAHGGPRFPSSVGQQAWVAVRLLLRGAGSLVGGTAVAGAVVMATGVVAVVWLGAGSRWRRAEAAVAMAGVVGALAAAAAVARARAGLPGFELVGSNRYVHDTAVPLAVAAVAIGAAVARNLTAQHPALVDRRRAVGALPAAVLVGGFLLSMPAEHAYARGFLDSNRVVHQGVRGTAAVLAGGCPSGAPPDPSTLPVGASSPQVSVALVAELVQRGHLHVSPDWFANGDVLAAVCPAG